MNDKTHESILHSRCPTCGKQHRIQNKYLGKQAKCNQCHTTFTVTSVQQNEASAKSETKSLEAQVCETIATESSESENSQARRSSKSIESEPTLKTISRFQVKGIVGAGAYGIVYRAYDPVLRRQVALKEPKFDIREKRKRRRFMTEAKSAAQLRHPNIVAVFDGGETDEGRPYIAAEFIDGQPLSAFIDELEAHPLSIEMKVGWVMELAGALAYAHSEGIIHRDIKPDNILVDRENNRPQITDFGLAKQLDDAASAMTNDGTILGTPVYMSPEQARGQLDLVGPHSDQYSLGVVLYELLTGKTPYHGEPYAVVAAVAGPDEPPAVRTLNPEITKDLAAICEKAMEKESEHRYPDCAEFAADLQRWLEGETVVARPPTLMTRMLRWTRRHPATILASAAGLLVFVLTVGLILLTSYQGELKLALERTQTAEANATELAKSNAALAEKEKQAATQERTERLRAEKAEASAKAAQKEAEEAEAEERKERIRAEQAEVDAKAAQKEAEEARAAAFAAQRKLDRLLATSRIKSADTLMQNSATEVTRAVQLLDEVPEAHRSWDWNFLRARHGNPLLKATLSQKDGRSIDVRLNSDGTRLAVVQQFAAQVIDTATGKRIASFERPENFDFVGIKFSNDDRLIVTAAVNLEQSELSPWHPRRNDIGCITVWDANTGKEIQPFKFRGRPVDFCISPKGDLIAGTLFGGPQYILCDRKTGVSKQISDRELSTTCGTNGIAFSPTGTSLIGANREGIEAYDIWGGNVRKYSAATGTQISGQIALDPAGRFAAYGDETGQLRVIDLKSNKPKLNFKAHRSPITSVTYHPTEEILATTSPNSIRWWSASNGEPLGSIEGLSPRSFAWPESPTNPHRFQFASFGGLDCSVATYRRIDHRPDQIRMLSERPRLIRSVQFSDDSEQLIFEGRYGPVVLDASNGNMQNSQQSSLDVMDVTVDPGRSKLARSYTDGRIEIVDFLSDTVLKTIQISETPISRLQISPNGDILACLASERAGKLSMWGLHTGDEIWTVDAPNVAEIRPRFSPDGKLVSAIVEAESIKLWESTSGTLVREFAGDFSEFAISPHSDAIAVGNEIGFITLWDINSGDKLGEISAGSGPITSLAFAPDGRRFVSLGNDGLIHLWDVETLQETISFNFPDLEGEAPHLCFSPDGRWLTCSTDKAAYFWDAEANW